MRDAVVFGAVLMLAAGGARGEALVATRPGVMCRSADVLGRLTLPNGDSRTHAAVRRPEDVALAESGGCIDIPPGARVTVRQAFRNTSIVGYGAPDGPPYVVPNIDFAAAGPGAAAGTPDAPAGAMPAGYAVVQRMPVAGAEPDTLVLLEDRRLTPRVRDKLWGGGDVTLVFEPTDPIVADVKRRPLLNARLQLLSPTGAVLAERKEEYPLAKIEAAPIHGLPTPAVLFTVDMSVGWGGFHGPATWLLTPATTQLTPLQFVPEGKGKGGEIGLAATLHALWQIVPARRGGPEEIESVYCPGGDEVQVLTLWTYRFHDGQWHRAERRGGECGDLEVMPPRSAFP